MWFFYLIFCLLILFVTLILFAVLPGRRRDRSPFQNTLYAHRGLHSGDEKYPENVTLDGVAASKIEYTATLAGDQYKFMNIICVVGAELYIFTYTSTVDLYDSHTEDVQSILDNFAFIR